VVYESQQALVRLEVDPRAGTGHAHPTALATDQIATVLKGVRVLRRNVIVGFIGQPDEAGIPAFSTREILVLAPHLARALEQASPKELVTFVIMAQDPGRGPVLTSGGLFVRNGHLYVILANARTSPSGVQYENTYAIDLKDQPLLPIARFKFAIGFVPTEARLPLRATLEADGYPGYLDESKLIVLDLARLFGQPTSLSPASQPRGASPSSKTK
jgi:hypothetical protein